MPNEVCFYRLSVRILSKAPSVFTGAKTVADRIVPFLIL